jgi:hypothetical protein
VPGPFLFTGLSLLGYPSYADTDTGKTLVAEPGESYGIRAVDGGAVPPPDGRWTVTEGDDSAGWAGPPEPPPPVPEVPGVPPVPGPEGGEQA